VNRSKLPAQAREGLMRAWLDILKQRHPDMTWIARDDRSSGEPVTEPECTEITRTLAA
jgi:hypothetical protein